mmetsp:Transcript_28428/g.49094  ORF Transcript_28428/g.49094 Transcript_28428/m.49094 type:complete len:147 (-) Transcript_28428:1135-1575(-)
MFPPNNEILTTNNSLSVQDDALLLPAASAVIVAGAQNLDNVNNRPTKRLKHNDSGGGERDSHRHVAVVSSTDSSRVASPININHIVTIDPTLPCLKLLFAPLPPSPSLNSHPPPTTNNNMNNAQKVTSFRELWTTHGFRTSMVTSP